MGGVISPKKAQVVNKTADGRDKISTRVENEESFSSPKRRFILLNIGIIPYDKVDKILDSNHINCSIQ